MEMAGVGIWVGNLEEEPEREDDTSATPVVGDPAFEGALTSLADMVTGEGGAVAVRTVTVSCFAELEANVGLADVDRTGTVTLNRLRALLLPPEGFALPGTRLSCGRAGWPHWPPGTPIVTCLFRLCGHRTWSSLTFARRALATRIWRRRQHEGVLLELCHVRVHAQADALRLVANFTWTARAQHGHGPAVCDAFETWPLRIEQALFLTIQAGIES